MKVLVACEESQAVCKAFREAGHEAYSCDIQECSGGHPEWHIKGDVLKAIQGGNLTTQSGDKIYIDKWNMLIGHPPCTYISYAGTQSWNNPGRVFLRLEALNFFAQLWEAPIEMICLENPKSCASPVIAKYSQEIQPYYFGDSDLKTTWLWLKGLPPLKYELTGNLFSEQTAVDRPEPIYIDNTERKKKRYFTDANKGSGGSKKRSKTFPGIARAMAEQWGCIGIKSVDSFLIQKHYEKTG